MQPTIPFENLSLPPAVHRAPQDKNQKKSELTSRPFLDGALELTKCSAGLVGMPFFLFFQGLATMCQGGGGGGFGPSPAGMGFLMAAAAPVYTPLLIGIGAPSFVLGATATFGGATACGVESLSRKIIDGVGSPSEATIQREELASQFIDKMKAILDELPYNQRHFFKEHPKELIMVALIAVAFRSRELKGFSLVTAGKPITLEDVAIQDSSRQDYFKKVCEVKEAIQSLHLSPNDDHGWKVLMEWLQQLPEEKLQEKDVIERNKVETLELLLKYADEASEDIAQDKLFQSHWSVKVT